MRNTFYIFFAALLFLNACKEDNDELVAGTAQEDLELKRITSAPWKIYRVEVSGLDVFNLAVPACQQDDSYRFYKDSSLMQYENSNVCSGNPDSASTHWEFYQGKSKLIGTVLGITDTAGVVALEDQLMKLSVDYNGNPALVFFKK